MSTAPSILFVHIGKELPAWLGKALRQARIFNSCPINLIAGREALTAAKIPPALGITATPLEEIGISERHSRFRNNSVLDKEFWDGFWSVTTERFFVLDSAIAHLALRNVVHLENDVLLYADLDALAPKLSRTYSSAAGTFINDSLCVPGLMYFPDAHAAARLADGLVEAVENMDGIPLPEGLNQHCDMSLLAAVRRADKTALDYLPILPPDYPAPLRDAAGNAPADASLFSRDFDALGFVFDAASLGQFLGGLHPRNAARPSIGFVNPTCVFDPRSLRPRIGIDPKARRVPQILTSSGVHQVANLHIHSKNLTPFLSA
jgi:hypothetical protein